MFKGMIALAAVTAFAVILQPAPAMADTSKRIAHVRVRDLNLASPGGVAELDRRIVRAATTACSVQGPTLQATVAERTCVQQALRSAYVQRDQLLAVVQFPQVAQLAPR